MKKTLRFSVLLTVIAVMAITWNTLTFFGKLTNQWSLPLLAVVTGVLAIILPAIARRIKVANSIVATGIATLLISTISSFLPEAINFWGLFSIIFLVALGTEILVHGWSVLHLGELMLDFMVSLLSTWILTYFKSTILITMAVLLVSYVFVIVLDFDFQFSLKKAKSDEDTEENTDNKTE